MIFEYEGLGGYTASRRDLAEFHDMKERAAAIFDTRSVNRSVYIAWFTEWKMKHLYVPWVWLR